NFCLKTDARRLLLMVNPDSKRNREILTLIVVFVLVLGASALAVYLIAGRSSANEASGQTATSAATERPSAPAAAADESFFDRLFGVPQSEAHIVRGESWGEVLAKIMLRLVLAALLGAALAFRPRKRPLIQK